MATGWLLLLLLLIAFSQSVYSQPTTDDQVCDGQHLNDMKRGIQMLLDNQKQLYHHLGKSYSIIRCVAVGLYTTQLPSIVLTATAIV